MYEHSFNCSLRLATWNRWIASAKEEKEDVHPARDYSPKIEAQPRVKSPEETPKALHMHY